MKITDWTTKVLEKIVDKMESTIRFLERSQETMRNFIRRFPKTSLLIDHVLFLIAFAATVYWDTPVLTGLVVVLYVAYIWFVIRYRSFLFGSSDDNMKG